MRRYSPILQRGSHHRQADLGVHHSSLGVGLVAYLVAWLIIPEEPQEGTPPQ